MGRHWDETDVAVRFPSMPVISPYRHEPGILALRAGIRLERHRGKSGDLGQGLFKPAEQLLVSLCLIGGANGWMPDKSGQVTGSISAVALSFIVQDPSGIMECTRDKSFACSRWRYRNISCSEWYELKTGCVR